MKIRLLLVVLGIVVVAGVAAIVFYSRGEQHSGSDSADSVDRIKLEMRAMPTATIHVDGKNVGTTPMSLQYPRSTRVVTVEATLVRHLVRRGAEKNEIYKDTRKVTLDHDQLLDFTFNTATLVDVDEEKPSPADTLERAGSAAPKAGGSAATP